MLSKLPTQLYNNMNFNNYTDLDVALQAYEEPDSWEMSFNDTR